MRVLIVTLKLLCNYYNGISVEYKIKAKFCSLIKYIIGYYNYYIKGRPALAQHGRYLWLTHRLNQHNTAACMRS